MRHRWGFAPGFGDVISVFNDQANAIVDGDGTVDELIRRRSQPVRTS